MKGNNEERGKEMLRESGLNFITADDMTEAAKKVVAAAGGDAMSVLVGKGTRLLVQGMGKHGTFHADRLPRLRHEGRGRRHARQGRHDSRGLPDLRQRAAGRATRRAPTSP